MPMIRSLVPILRSVCHASAFTAVFAFAAIVCKAHAIVISDDTFVRNGGNAFDVKGTVDRAMGSLHRQSLESQFLAVGRLAGEHVEGSCTATWIGDTADGRWSYFLTAALCVDQGQPSPTDSPVQRYRATFTDWSGAAVASGEGDAFLPFERLDPAVARPGSASTDLALVRLPRRASILGSDGAPVSPPVLYDGNTETGLPVTFVGYGQWGSGTPGCRSDFLSDDVLARRMAGGSVVNRLIERDHAIEAGFNPVTGGAQWARTARGDGGAPWWQRQLGFDTVVAVSSSTDNAAAVRDSPFPARSVGVRLSRYAEWIRSVFSSARFLSDTYTLTNAQPLLVTPDLAADAAQGSVAFVVPASQVMARGPTSIVWESGHNAEASRIQVQLVKQGTHMSHPVTLRAWRDNGLGPDRYKPMNNAAQITGGDLRTDAAARTSRLVIQYDPHDNPQFAKEKGVFDSEFDIDVLGWQDRAFKRTIRLKMHFEFS
ncbi:trypsin-like serine peptidase [Burkholderia ambifaria]|uniref:trypsin-like serine peptidase n=1 Tax=Burkholderia ambifaria TaxID=152480 RepID=UPI0015909C6B|nr:hypothetical protein [Burkholderia ambifaria]